MTPVVADDLVRRAQAGERQALVQLVETYQGQVYSLALAVTHDPTDAADMTQETFVRLLRTLGSFRGESSSFGTWLHRLTVNICLDHLRRRSRRFVSLDERQSSADSTSIEPASVDHWEEPAWRAEWEESALEVRMALAELSTAQREALTLHYLEDTSYDQIAARMGVPLNTVKSHILRGKERMARLLNPGGQRHASRANHHSQLRLVAAT